MCCQRRETCKTRRWACTTATSLAFPFLRCRHGLGQRGRCVRNMAKAVAPSGSSCRGRGCRREARHALSGCSCGMPVDSWRPVALGRPVAQMFSPLNTSPHRASPPPLLPVAQVPVDGGCCRAARRAAERPCHRSGRGEPKFLLRRQGMMNRLQLFCVFPSARRSTDDNRDLMQHRQGKHSPQLRCGGPALLGSQGG